MSRDRPSGRRPGRDTALVLLVLAMILVLAAGLRFYHLGSQSLWSDEGNSASLATRSLIQIAADAANDIHPPLYYFLLHVWTRVFGASEAGLRSLSALLGVLLVLVVGALGRRLYGESTGLIAAFLAALAPFQVYYSQEARMYVMLALQAATAVFFFGWLLSQEDRSLPSAHRLPLATLPGLLLAAIWVCGLYTHYAFPLMLGVLTLLYSGWLLQTRSRGQVGRRLLRWLFLLGLAGVGFAPWLPVALRQITTWPGGTAMSNPWQVVQAAVTTLGLGPAARIQAGEWWIWGLPLLALVGAVPQREGGRLRWLGWLAPLVWVAAPLTMMLGLGLFRDAYLKFLLVASPAYCLLLARGILAPARGLRAEPVSPATKGRLRATISRLRGVFGVAWVISALALVGVLFAATLSRYYTDPTVERDDYRGMVQFILATAQPNDAIVLDAPGQSEVFNYYYRGALPVYSLPRQRPLDLLDTQGELAKLLEHSKVYALYWAAEEADPNGLIQSWLDGRGYKTLDQWRGNVRLVVYVMPARRPPDESQDGLNLRLGSDFALLGYRGWDLKPVAGEVTQIRLMWQADRKPARRYKVFLQLLDSRDQVIAQRDSEPVGGSRPTDGWAAGEVISDNHGLLIPPGTPPGVYRCIVGMYDASSGERLRLQDGSDTITLPPVTVSRTATPPSLDALDMRYKQEFDFGGIALLGHDRYKRGYGHAPDAPILPGDRLHLTFYWRANVKPRADWWFDLVLSDSSGRTVASLQAPLVAETYSTTLWNKDEVVRGEHDLSIPADLPPDGYRLSLVLLPDTNTQAGTAYLGAVTVAKPGK